MSSPAQSPNKKRRVDALTSASITVCDNFINGAFVPPSTNKYLDVTTPLTGEIIGKVALSGATDVDRAVKAAEVAFEGWSNTTVKERAKVMFRFQQLIEKHTEELSNLIVKENGKNINEAKGDVAKGNETVEWATSIPQVLTAGFLEVSRGVYCREIQEPVGVVASIVPFNFPFMVPFWTIPIALVAGNCMILKPSEKVPMTMNRVVDLLKEAGVPTGVFQIVNGAVETVNAICEHPSIRAITFVGSSKVAEIVSNKCHALNKRVLALGGAKKSFSSIT